MSVMLRIMLRRATPATLNLFSYTVSLELYELDRLKCWVNLNSHRPILRLRVVWDRRNRVDIDGGHRHPPRQDKRGPLWN